MKRLFVRLLFVIPFLLAGAYIWYFNPREVVFTGETMGTTYYIKAYAPKWLPPETLSSLVSNRLIEINKSMSTYDPDSEISRFNTLASLDPFPISESFYYVVEEGNRLYYLTNGAWDGTVYPLVELWGFGRMKHSHAPSATDIEDMMRYVGFNNITLIPPQFIQKKHAKVTLDLSSIAKGYAVDEIARLFHDKGIKSFFIEVGGEIVTGAEKPNGTKWKIGISTPSSEASKEDIITAIEVANLAIATSGDYRNFYANENGLRYSHIINPKTGYPIDTSIVSATIIAPSCMTADGLATAVMVLPVNEALALLEKETSVEGFLITRDNKFHTTSGFPALTKPVTTLR